LLAAVREPCFAGSALSAVIDRDNAPSMRCFAACGFRPDDDADPGGDVKLVRRVLRAPWSTC
jgi:RimJ/RimL family protein N-acetyltransferase